MIRLTNLLRESQDAVTISATDTGDLKIWNRDSNMVYIWRLRIDPDVPLVADFTVTINDANTAKKQLTISYDPPVGAAVSNKTMLRICNTSRHAKRWIKSPLCRRV